MSMNPKSLCASVLLLLLMAKAGLCSHFEMLHGKQIEVQKRLTLGYERKGVKLYFVNTNPSIIPSESFEAIMLSHGGRRSLVKQMHDLKGLVVISSPYSALRYVRLRTSPSVWNAWSGRYEMEVVSRQDALLLPNYGLRDLTRLANVRSGYGAILSRQAYRQGGFSPARVERVQNGFLITRWILLGPKPSSSSVFPRKIQQISELVTRDGAYRRSVLKEMPLPKLPDTHWVSPRYA